MKVFWKLFSRSVIVTGTIALVLIVTVCVLAILQRPIPDILLYLVSVVTGFFFGAKIPEINSINASKK